MKQPATAAIEARLPSPPAPATTSIPDRARGLNGTTGADRRPVTVLFADLAGFTALSERLDPEEIRALQGDLFHEMAAVIDRYEGFREKFVGDAVMAVFGAPVAHEDDPERALHAALAMLERMETLSGRWGARLGRPLALHVGVNTGHTPEIWQAMQSASVGLLRELKQPDVPLAEAYDRVGQLDGFQVTEHDLAQQERNQAQLTAQFLIDREGIVRWANIECARDGLAGVSQMPSDEELLAAARAL